MRAIVAEDSFLRDLLLAVLPKYRVAVVGVARTADELLTLVRHDPPELVIVDVAMPRSDPNADIERGVGIEAAKRIRQRYPRVAIFVLSQYAEVRWAEEVATLGMGVGYQVKDRLAEIGPLVDTMRAVAAGDIRIDKNLVAAALARRRNRQLLDRLSARERQVLAMMAEGMSNGAIAEQLVLGASTVEGYETAIYRTLGLSHLRAEPGRGTQVNRRVMAVLAHLRSGGADQTPASSADPAVPGCP